MPVKFVNFLRSRLIFNIFYCSEYLKTNFSHISRMNNSKSKSFFNVKPSTNYFHTKTKILPDFQICISVPLSDVFLWRKCHFQLKQLCSHRVAYDYSRPDWDGLRDHLRYVPWESTFGLSASAAISEFCECVQVASHVYIPHRQYQVKPQSSPWFSAAFAAAIARRNHFFCFY